MEAWGRGIPDIFDLCKENGLPKPEFELANGFVYLTIRFKESLTPRLSGGVSEPQNEPLNGPLNETLKLLPAPVKTVYDAVKTNPGIRRAGIVAHTGLNLQAVKRAITVLLSKELIEHRGSAKTGGYYAKCPTSYNSSSHSSITFGLPIYWEADFAYSTLRLLID